MNFSPIAVTNTKASKALAQRESGMAIFVVLIVVSVLAVIVTQLVRYTAIEEQMAETRQGSLEISYSLHAVSRVIMLDLYNDWVSDQDGGEDEAADGAGAMGGASQGAQGTQVGSASNTAGKTYDTLFEDWAYGTSHQQQVNGVTIDFSILDGGRCLDINNIWYYVWVKDDPKNPQDAITGAGGAGGVGGAGDAAGAGEAGQGSGAAGTAGEVGEATEDEDAEEAARLDVEDEWEPPAAERIEVTLLMLERLVQCMEQYNAENGFYYAEQPNASSVAEVIVGWVEQRQLNEETRRITSLKELGQMPGMVWEVFAGPRDTVFDEALAEALESGLTEEEFYLEYYGSEEDGPYPGFEEVDFETLQGDTLPGVQATKPRPLGLRDLLTCYSMGKININTVHRVVLTALLVNIEDYDTAYEVAQFIDEHRHIYAEEEDADPGASGSGAAGSGGSSSAGSSSSGNDDEIDGEEDAASELNSFENFDQVTNIGEPDWSDPTAGAEENSIKEFLERDIRPIAGFHSTFFTARMKARKESQNLVAIEMEAEVTFVRHGDRIRVLAWRTVER